jgi:hypothetical protein
MPKASSLSDNDIYTIRCGAAISGDGDLSRACSLALWGDTPRQRSDARRKVAKAVSR